MHAGHLARPGPARGRRRAGEGGQEVQGLALSLATRGPGDGARKPTILFVTSNGEGLGHLTRMMAVARRCSRAVRPVFFTMSESFPIVARQGFVVEYFPFWRRSGLPFREWSLLLEERLEEVVEAFGADVVVFDGVRAYPAFTRLRERRPRLQWVWSRRGMWANEANKRSLQQEATFDLVVEPRDAAGAMDAGRTLGRHEPPVHAVAPVMLIDPEEASGRAEARKALGLPPDGPAVLLQLSCNSSEELVRASERTHEVVTRALPGASVFSPQHPLHTQDTVRGDRIKTKPVYPLGRYLRAFDFAVSGTGYNSFHELLAAEVPTLFVPKPDVRVDDQRGRARFAELAGFGLCAERYDDAQFDAKLEQLLTDVGGHRRMAAAARAIREPNGADEAAQVLEGLVAGGEGSVAAGEGAAGEGSGRRAPLPPRRRRRPRIETLASGAYLSEEDAARAERCLVVAVEHYSEQVDGLADGLARLQAECGDFRPIVVVRSSATRRLRFHGFLYERVMPRDQWERADLSGTYAQYLAGRLHGIGRMYEPHFQVELPGGAELTAEVLEAARWRVSVAEAAR